MRPLWSIAALGFPALPASLPAAAAVAALLPACATGPALTAEGLALRRVVIYRNGVGYFERAGRVESDRVTFRVRGNEVGDFLATFAVVEHGGSGGHTAAPIARDIRAECLGKES